MYKVLQGFYGFEIKARLNLEFKVKSHTLKLNDHKSYKEKYKLISYFIFFIFPL